MSITIFNNPANVLSSLTLNNLVLNINTATVGSVRAILTDCGDQFGPGGSLPGTNVDSSPAAGPAGPFPQSAVPGGDRGRLRWCAVTAAGPPAGNDGPPGGIGTERRSRYDPRANDFVRQQQHIFDTIGNFSGPNDSVNDLNRVVLFFLLLADRSGGNDRVATARILQQEKYGLAGVNLPARLPNKCSTPGPIQVTVVNVSRQP